MQYLHKFFSPLFVIKTTLTNITVYNTDKSRKRHKHYLLISFTSCFALCVSIFNFCLLKNQKGIPKVILLISWRVINVVFSDYHLFDITIYPYGHIIEPLYRFYTDDRST